MDEGMLRHVFDAGSSAVIVALFSWIVYQVATVQMPKILATHREDVKSLTVVHLACQEKMQERFLAMLAECEARCRSQHAEMSAVLQRIEELSRGRIVEVRAEGQKEGGK